MKVILLSSHTCGLPVLYHLSASGCLTGVASISESNPYNLPLEHAAEALQVSFRRFSPENLATGLAEWIAADGVDLVLVFGFRWKIPATLLPVPRFGFVNVHFSLLPDFRGPDPVFWQLKAGCLTGGITLHQVDADLDTGPIFLQHSLPFIPGETRGMCSARFSIETVSLVDTLLKGLEAGTLESRPQNGQSGSMQQRVQPADLIIDWERHDAAAIVNLVNAANPDYHGAATTLKGQEIRILEVTPASTAGPADHVPGTIVFAHPDQGIFVACHGGSYLRINIIETRDGIISGFKLAGMGIAPGERLLTMGLESDNIRKQPNIYP